MFRMWEKIIRWRNAGLVSIAISIFELPGHVDNFRGWSEWAAMIDIKDNVPWLLVVGVVLFFMPEIKKIWKWLVTRNTKFVGYAEPISFNFGLSKATGSTTPPSCWFKLKHWLKQLLATTEEKRKAEERRKHLRRYWELAPKDGRKAAHLMLVSNQKDTEDIYREFAPWDDDEQMLVDDTKKYRWAVCFAWACRLALDGKFDEVESIFNEAEFSWVHWDKSANCQDSKNDRRTFFVEPGGQKAFDEWAENSNKQA